MYQTVPGQTNSDQAWPQQDPVNKSIVKEEQHCTTHSHINADFLFQLLYMC